MRDFAGLKRRYLSAFVIGDKAFAGTGTNGTNFKDFWEFDQLLSTLTRPQTEVEVMAYPNPVVDQLTISIEGLDNAQLGKLQMKVYDLTGRLLVNESMSSDIIRITASNWDAGLYAYHIVYRDQIVRSGKILKR